MVAVSSVRYLKMISSMNNFLWFYIMKLTYNLVTVE